MSDQIGAAQGSGQVLLASTPGRTPAARLGIAVVKDLVTAVVTGSVHPGDTLPPESVLIQQFAVSRTVIRESVKRLEEKGLIFSGKHPSQPIMQVLELPTDVHPFFVGTQAHPEMNSRPLRPSPLFLGLTQAAMDFAAKANAAATPVPTPVKAAT